jgi:hypothetical protein
MRGVTCAFKALARPALLLPTPHRLKAPQPHLLLSYLREPSTTSSIDLNESPSPLLLFAE